MLSVVGDDEAGRSLSRLLEEGEIDAGMHVDRDIDTPPDAPWFHELLHGDGRPYDQAEVERFRRATRR